MTGVLQLPVVSFSGTLNEHWVSLSERPLD